MQIPGPSVGGSCPHPLLLSRGQGRVSQGEYATCPSASTLPPDQAREVPGAGNAGACVWAARPPAHSVPAVLGPLEGLGAQSFPHPSLTLSAQSHFWGGGSCSRGPPVP